VANDTVMFCSTCGARSAEGARFCASCGRPLSGTEPTSAPPSGIPGWNAVTPAPKRGRSPVMGCLLATLVVVTMIAVALWLASLNSSTSSSGTGGPAAATTSPREAWLQCLTAEAGKVVTGKKAAENCMSLMPSSESAFKGCAFFYYWSMKDTLSEDERMQLAATLCN